MEDEIEKRDEASFQKRKTKRMNIERSKLMPLNLGKTDVAKAIFRERCKAGASMADISPMEIDLKVCMTNLRLEYERRGLFFRKGGGSCTTSQVT